jgi:hypothetical protein
MLPQQALGFRLRHGGEVVDIEVAATAMVDPVAVHRGHIRPRFVAWRGNFDVLEQWNGG